MIGPVSYKELKKGDLFNHNPSHSEIFIVLKDINAKLTSGDGEFTYTIGREDVYIYSQKEALMQANLNKFPNWVKDLLPYKFTREVNTVRLP